MTYLDNHTHLDDIGLDDGPRPVEELVRLAALAGVDTLIHSGTDVASSRWAVEQAERFPGVWATVGYHPHEAAEADAAGFVASGLPDRPPEGAGAWARPVSTTIATGRPAPPRRPCSCATWSWPPRPGCPW